MTEREVFVSVFQEAPPDYHGGIWIIRNGKVKPIYRGFGVFGLCWLQNESILLGATRSADTPLIALRKRSNALVGKRYIQIPVEYESYINGRAAHGIWAWGNKLFLVASQGDPDSVVCTNEESANHYVGKVIVSNVGVESDHIFVRKSTVWNPFECDHHHHYNDIMVHGGFIYLSSFSFCDNEKCITRKGAVTRFRHDLSFDRVITDDLDAPHSLQIVEDRLYVCSSRTSSIHSISLTETEAQLKLEYKGINNFVRGLYVTPDYFFIGLSRSAGRTNSAHLTESISGILTFNRKNGVTTKIDFPANCDNVYSLLAAEWRSA